MNLKACIEFLKSHFLLIVLGAFLVLSVCLIYINVTQFEYDGDFNFHGPHFSSAQVILTPQIVISEPSQPKPSSPTQIATSTVVTRPAPIAVPPPIKPPVQTAEPAPRTVTPLSEPASIPVPVSAASEYGIAAGGGLIGLSQSDLDAYFNSLKALGVTWVRWDMDWTVIQSDNSTMYNWAGADRVAAAAAAYGINSLAIITYAPQWALDPVHPCTTDQHCPPLDPAVFAHFAAVAVARYKGTINTWEIWNEPNLNGAWKTAANGAGYAAYLKDAYTAIKQVEPSAIVLTGGLAAAADEGNNTSPTTFITMLYAAGAKNYFDAVALHPYSYPVDASYVAPWNSWQQMTGIRQIMVDNGDSAKKIWVTEYGAPTGGPGVSKDINELQFTYGGDYMSEPAQAQTVQDVMTLYNQDKSWMGPFFWYSLKDNGTDQSTPENFFGLLRYDGSQKPAYQAYKEAIGVAH